MLDERSRALFAHSDMEAITGLQPKAARNLVAGLVRGGVATRLKPGLFILVPFVRQRTKLEVIQLGVALVVTMLALQAGARGAVGEARPPRRLRRRLRLWRGRGEEPGGPVTDRQRRAADCVSDRQRRHAGF